MQHPFPPPPLESPYVLGFCGPTSSWFPPIPGCSHSETSMSFSFSTLHLVLVFLLCLLLMLFPALPTDSPCVISSLPPLSPILSNLNRSTSLTNQLLQSLHFLITQPLQRQGMQTRSKPQHPSATVPIPTQATKPSLPLALYPGSPKPRT